MDFLNAVLDIFTSQSTYVNGALFGGLLLFAASGEWIAERSGTINISVEAMLLAGAFTSAIGYHLSGSAAVGLLAGAMGGICAMFFGAGLDISAYDLGMTLFMGAFTIGIGIAFVTWGTAYVPAAEVSLLVLIESVLGPVWPWLFLGETLSLPEIIGGTVVLAAVAVLALTAREKTQHDKVRQQQDTVS